ncbi:hypothetical protein D3C80_1759390 [compost metagenome]
MAADKQTTDALDAIDEIAIEDADLSATLVNFELLMTTVDSVMDAIGNALNEIRTENTELRTLLDKAIADFEAAIAVQQSFGVSVKVPSITDDEDYSRVHDEVSQVVNREVERVTKAALRRAR